MAKVIKKINTKGQVVTFYDENGEMFFIVTGDHKEVVAGIVAQLMGEKRLVATEKCCNQYKISGIPGEDLETDLNAVLECLLL